MGINILNLHKHTTALTVFTTVKAPVDSLWGWLLGCRTTFSLCGKGGVVGKLQKIPISVTSNMCQT